MNSPRTVLRRVRGTLAILLVAALALLGGYWVGSAGRGGEASSDRTAGARGGPAGQEKAAPEKPAAEVWTCSMHPQIRRSGPGKCPICGMDLIPVAARAGGGEKHPRRLTLSPYAEKLAEIQVAPVERKFVTAKIRMVGKVVYDETRLGYITAWVPGRIDRLFVDYTGVPVKKGDEMVYLYSPELLSAQEELFQAKKALADLQQSGLPLIRQTAVATVKAVRERLRLWGLTPEQIADIEKRSTPSDHMTIVAPMTGIVIHKKALEGMYVRTGTRIYTIADLTGVWVKLDAYESDLTWIRYGQTVEFTTEAYPGETFKGRISFIDPVLDDRTRTVKVRVNVPNPDGRLKPEMFVRGVVRSRVAAGGKVMDPELAGKWISPRHPEIVRDQPGKCPICGIPLVRAESLGYIAADPARRQAPLVIPASAPLITGTRAVVYVRVPDVPGAYEGREIVLGPRAGDHYIVHAGLEEGEEVVVNGNFKIDSAIQILARPSMMNPEGGGGGGGHHHHGGAPKAAAAAKTPPERFSVPGAFTKAIDRVLDAYFAVHEALSHDRLEPARAGAAALASAVKGVDMNALGGKAHVAWMKAAERLEKSAGALGDATDLARAREAFLRLSEASIEVAKAFGTGGTTPVLRFHCPMAFDGRGADWLQHAPETANPYFGSAMFGCGKQTEAITKGEKK